MAKFHWGGFIINDEGQPIEGADISVYLAGTTEPAYVFDDEFASSATNSVPQTISRANGYFEFGIADPEDEKFGYDSSQKFKVNGNKTGIEEGYVDYIDVFPPLLPVNEFDTDTTKDKSVSNFLANVGERHRLDDSHIVHGIEEADETRTETVKNKLVSNYGVNEGETHSNTYFAPSGSDTILEEGDIDTPHGLDILDFSATISTSGDYYMKNKLVSYEQGKGGQDHIELDYTETPHDIREVVENDDSDTNKNRLVSNSLIHYLMYETRTVETVNSGEWSPSGSNYILDVEHSLDDEYPFVQAGNTDTKEQIDLTTIQSLNDSEIRIEYTDNINAKVLIAKGE